MSEDIMLMEMPGAFERGQHDSEHTRPDVVPRVGDARNNARQQHSIPLTGYRLLTTIVIVGIGIPKAVYSYRGQPLISTSLDWVGGIMFALLLFWLGVVEATRPELCPNFFEVDLAYAIPGFLCGDDTPSPSDPATLGPLRRGYRDTTPLAPEILGVSSDDASPSLAPEVLRELHRGDTPHTPPFPASYPAYISRQPPPLPPSQIFPELSIPENTHLATPAPPMLQLSGTTTDHQKVAPAMPGFKPVPPRFAMVIRTRLSRPLDRWGYLDANESEPEVDLADLRDEEFELRAEQTSWSSSHTFHATTDARIRHAPPHLQETAPQESASLPVAPPDLPDLQVPCRLCGRMSPRRYGGFCSEMHKWGFSMVTPENVLLRKLRSRQFGHRPTGGGLGRPERLRDYRAPPNLPDLPCRSCRRMYSGHYAEPL